MGAGPFLLITGVILPPHPSVLSVLTFVTLTFLLSGAGAACRWRPGRVPPISWVLAPFLGLGLITALNLCTQDASTGAQLFYLWPVLYAANFLSRQVISLTLVAVSAADATGVFPMLDLGNALSDWSSLTIAMTLTAVIVASLRSRNDRLRAVLETQAFTD